MFKNTTINSYYKVHMNWQSNGLIVIPSSTSQFALCRAFSVFIFFLGFCEFKHSEAQWSLYVPPVVTICTTRFNIQQFYFLPTQCIYVFCMDLRKKTAIISLYNIN